MSEKPNLLREIFIELNTIFQADLNLSKITKHPGAKGDATEIGWEKLLKEHLPFRYQIQSKAFIFDHTGNISDQIDLVIFDRQYSAALVNKQGIAYLPSESVYAIFEVKQILNSVTIQYAQDKAESVRKLHRSNKRIQTIGGPQKLEKHSEIIAGLLCTSCSWKYPINKVFTKYLINKPELRNINIGCIAKLGTFEIDYLQDSKEPIIIFSPQNITIAFFLFKLLEKLQIVGTCPAIEYDKYLEAVLAS